jgi:hypothetical protein
MSGQGTGKGKEGKKKKEGKNKNVANVDHPNAAVLNTIHSTG